MVVEIGITTKQIKPPTGSNFRQKTYTNGLRSSATVCLRQHKKVLSNNDAASLNKKKVYRLPTLDFFSREIPVFF